MTHKFRVPSEDKPDRKGVNEVEARYQVLARGVLQISTRPNTGDLLGDSNDSGSGFLLSQNGLFLTNRHVVAGDSQCMEKLVCTLDFTQVQPSGERAKFSARVELLIASSTYDIALIKIHLPPNLNFAPFQIEKQTVGSRVLSLGYPADRMDDNMWGKTSLTYSFGQLVGFFSRTYSTSVFGAPGASGSPLLNDGDLNLIGIISNGTQAFTGNSSPLLARPIALIDSEFGLSDYVSGAKDARVQQTLSALAQTTDIKVARQLLRSYENEKTFLQLNAIKNLLINHPVAEIRALIRRSLERMNVMIGSRDDFRRRNRSL